MSASDTWHLVLYKESCVYNMYLSCSVYTTGSGAEILACVATDKGNKSYEEAFMDVPRHYKPRNASKPHNALTTQNATMDSAII